MERPFKMLGSEIQIYHFCVSWIDNNKINQSYSEIDMPNINVKIQELAYEEITEYQITEIDTTILNWLDGIDIGECNMEKAIEIWQMGEQAYTRKLAFDKAKQADKLRADLDYVILMGGL